MMALKPQDIYVVLKILANAPRWESYSLLAAELVMSPSEVHACVKRAQASSLMHGPAVESRPNISALEEFLIHGLKYVFPAQRGEPTRGLPTSYGAEPLRSALSLGGEEAPVWPYEHGRQRGVSLTPLYKTAPIAALRDPVFYEYLALADALRDGRARERKIAEKELQRRLRRANGRSKS